jgi:D-sedoheptulose 7-phosphate isomerase
MTDAARYVAHYLAASRAAMDVFAADAEAAQTMRAMAEAIAASMRAGGKLLAAGNGGSAADAQHIAAELVGRFVVTRRGLPAIALTTDSSALTSIANDFGYERVFSRQIEALARPGDSLLAISTSGRSPNVLAGIEAGRAAGCSVVGLTGGQGGSMTALCDVCLAVPGRDTQRVQEMHSLIGHLLCGIVEKRLCG